tara:strand:+ start:12194 stop:17140 length:4947 start_codon:yes stop_codon:yes gene_type:complete
MAEEILEQAPATAVVVDEVVPTTPEVVQEVVAPKAMGPAKSEAEVSRDYDIMSGSDFSLDDFDVGVLGPVKLAKNARSVKVSAATTALLSSSPEAALESYQETVAQDLDEAGDPLDDATTNSTVLAEMRASETSANRSASGSLLMDESISPEIKQAALFEINNGTSALLDPMNKLGAQGLEKEGKFETPVAAEQRLDMANILQTVNQERLDLHRLKQSYISNLDPNTAGALADVASWMAPFLEPHYIEDIYQGMRESGLAPDIEQGAWMMGAQKGAIMDALNSAPPETRLAIAGKLAELIKEHVSLPVAGGIDMTQFNMMLEMLSGEEYTDTDEAIDNIFHVLDMSIIGGPLAATLRTGGKLRRIGSAIGSTMESVTADIARASVRAPTPDYTPAKVVQSTNPDNARDIHKMMSEDELGEAAEALYGTNRNDALVDDIQAQIVNEDGSVNAKVGDLDLDVSEEVLDLTETGQIYRTDAEKEYLHKQYTGKAESVKGMKLHREMVTVGNTTRKGYEKADVADGVEIDAIYGPAEGGFDNADEAMELTLRSQADIGITEKDITILQRDGDSYVEVTLEEAKSNERARAAFNEAGVQLAGIPTVTPNYLVRVKHHMKFNDADVGAWSELDVKRNPFTRMVASAREADIPLIRNVASALDSYLFDPASQIHKTLFKGASKSVATAAAIEKEILESGGAFAKSFAKLGTKRQLVLENVIKEANEKGIRYNNTDALADGITSEEFLALANWKRTWDTIYSLENLEAVRGLKAGGFKEYISSASDTKLFGKEVRQANIDSKFSYNPETGKSVEWTQVEVDELYAKGGSFVKLRNEVATTGKDGKAINAEYTVVEGGDKGSYLRELSDDSVAINYREGYYSVKYKDKWFIDQKFTKPDGTEYTKAVGVTGTEKGARLLQRRLDKQNPGKSKTDAEGNVTYVGNYNLPRPDMKGSASDLDAWDIAHSTGRSAQKVRGERLMGELGDNMEPSQAYIQGPVESMIASARSIANRTAMKPVIDTAKARFLEQYKDYLPTDPKSKQTLWPGSLADIEYRGDPAYNAKKIAEARSAWNYVNYLENGYINAIDVGYKAAMNGMANMTGSHSDKVGKMFNYLADTRGPSAVGKNLAFTAYIALNPFRQAIIQGHQAIQLIPLFGKEVATKLPTHIPILTIMQMTNDVSSIPKAMLKAAGLTAKEAGEMSKAFKQSGLVAQIDKQNLVRSGMSHLADQSSEIKSLNKVESAVSNSIGFVRKAGFDVGESFNMMTAWSAHYNKAKSAGKDMKDKAVLDHVAADAINYTYNMNAAGDMRYNVDSLSNLFQFLQVPHKAMLQMTTNRVLSLKEKAALAGWNTLVYGVPSAVVYKIIPESVPEDSEMHHALRFGMESLILNKLLNDVEGTETDFSGMAALNSYGWGETITEMLTSGIGEAFQNTPSAKLFVGNTARFKEAAKTLMNFMNITKDSEIEPTTFLMTAREVAKIASGFSNFDKRRVMENMQKKHNILATQYTDEDMFRRAWFGFPAARDSNNRYANSIVYKESADFRESVKSWYGSFKNQLLRAGIDPREMEYGLKMVKQAGNEAWGDDPVLMAAAYEQINGLMRKDGRNKDTRLVERIWETTGLRTGAQTKALIMNLPDDVPGADRQRMLEIVDFMEDNRK